MVFRCMDRIWFDHADPAKIVPELASAMRVFIEYNTPSEQGSSAEISSPVPVSEEECFPGVR